MITVKNSRVSLTVAPEYGSNMTSFAVDGRELIYTDPKLLKNHDFTGCFVLWPFPNRVRNRKYRFNGKEYSLEKVAVPRGNYPLIHGLVRDEKWQFAQNKNKITAWIEVTPRFRYWDCFPWRSRLTLTYALLKNGVKIGYEAKNLDTAELGFGFGLHPLFKDAFSLKAPAKYVMAADKELLPGGKLLTGGISRLMPAAQLDLDHVFTGLAGPQTVVFKNGLKLKITASKDFTHCVVYTGEKDKFSCVEQQTCSTDAHNLDAWGYKKEAHLIRVKPGKTKKGWIKYEVG